MVICLNLRISLSINVSCDYTSRVWFETAREEALALLDQYPVQEDMANPPTLEEYLAAMKSGKTPGLDGIPAEIYKYGGTALHAQLLKFYHICWTAKELPQQFKDALIIAVY